MKKILCILLSISVLFGLCACGNNSENKEPTNQSTQTNVEGSNGLKFKEFYYDATKWDELENKENVELKLCGISAVPFNVVDFKDNVTELHAFHVYTKGSNDSETIKDFNQFIDGTKMIKPSYSTTAKNSINIDLDNGATFEMMVTAPTDEEYVEQDILKAVSEGRHYYYAAYDVDVFLDIDMTGIEFSTAGDKPNAKPLLDKAIEKLGKPTSIKMEMNSTDTETDNDYLTGMQSYSLVYEFSDYTLVIAVHESQVIFGDTRDTGYIGMSAFVFAPNAWKFYKAEKNF